MIKRGDVRAVQITLQTQPLQKVVVTLQNITNMMKIGVISMLKKIISIILCAIMLMAQMPMA